MFWAQGWSDLRSQKEKYAADHACVQAWKQLYPPGGSESGWKLRLLDDDDAKALSPRYAEVRNHSNSGRLALATASDLLRLDLLSRYGGVWTDTSVCPFQRLESWLPEALAAREGLFFPWAFKWKLESYPAAHLPHSELGRFKNCQYASDNAKWSRPLETFFLAAAKPHDPMIDAWADALNPRLLEVLARPTHEPYPYYIVHCSMTLARLRDASVDERWQRIRASVAGHGLPRIMGTARRICGCMRNHDNPGVSSPACEGSYAESHCYWVKKAESKAYQAYLSSPRYREYVRGLGSNLRAPSLT